MQAAGLHLPGRQLSRQGNSDLPIFPGKTFEKFNIEKLQDAFAWSMLLVRLQNLYKEKYLISFNELSNFSK